MERVLILGATSAIAAEVAMIHGRRGDRLHLVGRSREKLDALVRRLEGARVTASAHDLGEPEQNGAIVREALEALGGIDRVLIAHGELGDQLASEREFSEVERSFRINWLSPVALLIELSAHFEERGSGRIGVITSVAGERGRPRNYTYGAAKGGLTLYLQGLRSRLYGTGISVTNLKLGPVDTPMTRDHEKNALFAQPARVARSIVRAMDRGRGEVFVPWFWAFIMPVVRLLPEPLFQRFGFLAGR